MLFYTMDVLRCGFEFSMSQEPGTGKTTIINSIIKIYRKLG